MVHSLSGRPFDGRAILNWVPDYADLACLPGASVAADAIERGVGELLSSSASTMALTDAVERLFRAEREALLAALSSIPLA